MCFLIFKRLLDKINEFYGVGFITKERVDVIKYCLHSIKDLSVIIDHLEKISSYNTKKSRLFNF